MPIAFVNAGTPSGSVLRAPDPANAASSQNRLENLRHYLECGALDGAEFVLRLGLRGGSGL